MKKLSIYLHIPFCIKKCAYCDFLSAPADDVTRRAYITALEREITAWHDKAEEYVVDTVFFGGGTPSCLEYGLLEQILCRLKEVFYFSNKPEITVEVNPGTVDITKMQSYWNAGINRLSIGLQSPFEEDLRALGRIHDYSEFMLTYNGARQVGFHNINVDLMSALPGQTVERYKEGLHKVLALKPEHISSYSLIIEENTPFYNRYVNHKELLPDEDAEREMYDATEQILSEYGYHRYEISNYAREGFDCRHNLVYWQGGDYLGLGLGASSMMNHIRFKGIDRLSEYLKKWSEVSEGFQTSAEDYEQVQILSVKEQMEEFMFLGLRCMTGVSGADFFSRFGVTMESIYEKQLKKLTDYGLMECVIDNNSELCKQNKRWRLTKRGIDVSNAVFVEFLL